MIVVRNCAVAHLRGNTAYDINDFGGLGRRFDGIGGLSGGGATSRLLVNYPEPYKTQVLDYLFKPNFGASLHILKVEIGGDGQSTEGTESSHMHNENDESYTRGYEWWLMNEAKLRNPDILLIGLPWAWPGWIGQGTAQPYKNVTLTATYILKWISGAKTHHGLDIDYVGIWNEKPYNVEYIKTLRKVLDSAGFTNTKIIADDGSLSSNIAKDILNDSELSDAVDIVGVHYPGTISTSSMLQTGKQLWASEDYSTYNDVVGAGCWARLLNQNYVNGKMTATISWNLVASYYDALPYKRCSLMTANEPWSGYYDVTDPLWVTAHTTQFTKPGWHYLPTSSHLAGGGSYVSLVDSSGNLTIVIETMSHDASICIRPPLPSFNVTTQDVVFNLDGKYKNIKEMNLWHSTLGPQSTKDQLFKQSSITVVNGKVSLPSLPPNMIVTLTTVTTATKGSFPTPPASSPFPLPYSEDFDDMTFSEPNNFADQSGKFEIFKNESSANHKSTLRQVVTQRPVTWCDDADQPFTVIGNHKWDSVSVSVSMKSEGSYGIFAALRVDEGGCTARGSKGVFFWLMKNKSWQLTFDLARSNVIKECSFDWNCWDAQYSPNGWNNVTLSIGKENKITATLNGVQLFSQEFHGDVPSSGWVALGVAEFAHAQFDDFSIEEY